MPDIKNIQTPPLLREVGIPERQYEERPSETWEFRKGNTTFNFLNGKIMMNKQDLSRLISENLTHLGASYWTQIARRLDEYRQWALRHISDPEQLAVFAALVHAFLNKIGGRLKRKFDEKIDGISFHFEEGQLSLNGINIHAFIEMARKHRTQKAKIFLKGLKNRLGLMLSNRHGNPNYEKLRDVVDDLMHQIDLELSKPSTEIILLPPKNS